MTDRRDSQKATKHNGDYGAKHLDKSQPSGAASQPKKLLYKKRLLFFGNERLATGTSTTAPTLSALIDAGYDIVGVVTSYSEARSRSNRELEIKEITTKHNIPLLIPEDLVASKKELVKFGADCAVLVAFGKIVPQEIINIFPVGIVNVHPSLLPKHRGPIPIESVILDGSAETGVSIMQLVKAMDAGPVYAQQTHMLNGDESKQELADSLGKLGSELILKNLPAILDGHLKPKAQNDSEATYDKLITKLDGRIDWNLRAESIERQIRAYSGWPGSRTDLFGKEVVILAAEVVDKTGIPGEVLTQDKQLVVCCGDKGLNITSLKPAGKQGMSGQAFIAGYAKK